MRTCLQTFRPEGADKVTKGEAFADDHPIVLAHDAMFSADDTAEVVTVPGWIEPAPDPEPVPKPRAKKAAP